VGWALANMWYDKFDGMPPRGSPLESLFILVYLQRQEAHLLATRAIVQSTIPEGSAAKPAIEAFQKYCDTMFPFIKKAETEDEHHQRLAEFIKHRAKIDLRPIYKAQADSAKQTSIHKMMRIKPSIPGVHQPAIPGKKSP
jgi:hypothetical protein